MKMLHKARQMFSNIALSILFIFIAFGALDAFWLGYLAKPWYQSEMSGMLREQFITWPWMVFYLMYGCVTFVLAVIPNRDKPWFYAAIDGALLGLASYGAYNLTAYSIMEGFTLKIMMIDWAWGTALTCVSASAGYLGFNCIKKQ